MSSIQNELLEFNDFIFEKSSDVGPFDEFLNNQVLQDF